MTTNQIRRRKTRNPIAVCISLQRVGSEEEAVGPLSSATYEKEE